MDTAIGHVSEDRRRQPLLDHLRGTARMAGEFAAPFAASQWAALAGLWHDLGKYAEAFQTMMESAAKGGEVERQGVGPHSTAGAIHAVRSLGEKGRIIAYIIAGHHAGLPDYASGDGGMASLEQRVTEDDVYNRLIQNGLVRDLAASPPTDRPPAGADPSTWIRMLFSCCVDADYLDTESFMEPARPAHRETYPTLADLYPKYAAFISEKTAAAIDTPVNRIRADILRQCLDRGEGVSGIYTLTAPTGGGKTLSSMGFALRHALTHAKRRIIYVIPYTSIVEQISDQFRAVFGDAVVEHHSGVSANTQDGHDLRQALATENWDAPIIVTTSVQFFESLFASRPGRCRKLHNIVNSVVVLDEAQLLPPDFLKPILTCIRDLNRSYGVTFVLSTATQPALSPRTGFGFSFEGLPGTVEIMPDPRALHSALRRFSLSLPKDLSVVAEWESLAAELRELPSFLCIVNRRDDCRILYELLPRGTVHLSGLMCGAHRSKIIADIKKRLMDGIPTRVVATQLVEAGVDIDFPVVYRALAGLDSIAQAGGRCNREGRLQEGRLVVFIPPSQAPPGHLRQCAELGRQLLSRPVDDHLAPDMFAQYFRELYWIKGDKLDAKGILARLAPDAHFRFSFRSAATDFRIIDDAYQVPVIVQYAEGATLANLLVKEGPSRWLQRKLQRYVVNVPKWHHERLVGEESVMEIAPGFFYQTDSTLYHEDTGLSVHGNHVARPDDLIV